MSLGLHLKYNAHGENRYWSRYLRRNLRSRRPSRTQTIPDFSVPEIVIAGEDGVISERPPSVDTPMIPSMESRQGLQLSHVRIGSIDSGVSSGSQLRNRSPSSPTRRMDRDLEGGSPISTRWHGREGSDVDLDDQLRDDDRRPSFNLNRPKLTFNLVEDEEDGDQQQRRARATSSAASRSGSASVAASRDEEQSMNERRRQNVLDVLDNSAWGESIRRTSSSLRRPER